MLDTIQSTRASFRSLTIVLDLGEYDEELKQAEAKFRSDTKALHAANYHAAHQVLRTDKAAAELDNSTASGASADTLIAHEKQLQANERLSAGLIAKRNDLGDVAIRDTNESQ